MPLRITPAAVGAVHLRHRRILIRHRAAVIRHPRDPTRLRLQAVLIRRLAAVTRLPAAVMAAEAEVEAGIAAAVAADRMAAVVEDPRMEAEATPEAVADRTDIKHYSLSPHSLSPPQKLGRALFFARRP